MVIGSPLGGRVAARFGPRPPIVVGLATIPFNHVVLERLLARLPGYLVPRMVREVAGAAYKMPLPRSGTATGEC